MKERSFGIQLSLIFFFWIYLFIHLFIKGLAEEQRQKLLKIANDEAEANEGMPAIFAVCEAVRTWLGDNNIKGLDDGSMHAQMMRRAREEAINKVRNFLGENIVLYIRIYPLHLS